MDEDYLGRTRSAYGGSASRFADLVGVAIGDEFETVGDQAVLAAFVATAPEGGLVVDAGCGPGRVARFLADREVRNVLGIDIAPGMIDEARAAHPDLRFEVAPLTAIPVQDATADAVVYWYSIITTPPAQLHTIWTELNRVLNDQGRALISFQAGSGEADPRPNAYGTTTDLTLYQHDPSLVSETLTSAGFTVESSDRRRPQLEHETTDQAILTCRR